MTVFRPDSPKKRAPAEFRAFQHRLVYGSSLFLCLPPYFRAQKPLAAYFGSSLFPTQFSPRFSFRIYVFYRAENGGIYSYSGQSHIA